MGQLMGEHGFLLGRVEVGGKPRRQNERRTPPSKGHRRGQAARLEHGNRPPDSHPLCQSGDPPSQAFVARHDLTFPKTAQKQPGSDNLSHNHHRAHQPDCPRPPDAATFWERGGSG
jgi:hypothetical protein